MINYDKNIIMKNKVISGIVLLLTLACTVFIYYLLFDEHSKLFYINLVTACLAEIILLANIPMLSNDKLLTFKNAATTTILNVYAISLFLWTTIYSLCIEGEEEYKILYIGMLSISIIFIVLLGITELGGNFMKGQEQSMLQTTQNKKTVLISLHNYWSEIQQILQNINYEKKDDLLHDIRIVLDKITVIPSVKLENNPSIASEINLKLNDLKKQIDTIAKVNDSTSAFEETMAKVEQLNNYIISIKSSL